MARKSDFSLLARTLDLFPDPAVVRRAGDDVYLVANRAFIRIIGQAKQDVEGRRPEDVRVRFDPSDWEEYDRRLVRDGAVRDFPLHVTLPDGTRRTWLASSAREEVEGTDVIIATTKDVTELEEARLQAERHLRRVQALHEIDMAIAGSLDVRVTLGVVLAQILEHLGVDAAAVLLWSDTSRKLEFAAGRGFHTAALEHTRLAPGEGYAGQVARDRTTRIVRDLEAEPDGLTRSRDLGGERFRSYAATPLVAKGQLRGVLEVFSRSTLAFGREWREFLEVLAGQSAIALDGARLLEELRSSHEHLLDAYDHTIAGWARALTMRDAETWDHTERVTEVTLRLARRLGLPEDELIHVRHGALLHDIGKVGVPDSILRKPGPLDDDEWRVMREHPTFAYQLLSPIDFLRPALPIPYAHHEKWDGSGYPLGLTGANIPRAARIFAVVDVWDALRSDRPYRNAWDVDRTLAHLREQAGAHFDPAVVAEFLALHDEAGLEEMRPN